MWRKTEEANCCYASHYQVNFSIAFSESSSQLRYCCDCSKNKRPHWSSTKPASKMNQNKRCKQSTRSKLNHNWIQLLLALFACSDLIHQLVETQELSAPTTISKSGPMDGPLVSLVHRKRARRAEDLARLKGGPEEETGGESPPGTEEPSSEQDGSHIVSTNQLAGSKLRIVRLFAPEAVQNGTQNVTLDCMFKFDRKLDQRLTVKWFFNDELEPIYQWIPELNKRVYSDKYERFLDKSYEVIEDVDFMLQAYRWTLANGNQLAQADGELELSADSTRHQLAGRLNKLAKLGGKHSSQLLDSLRAALDMDSPEFSRFRALRLVRPTSELSGRFTCSVSSLDGDDLRSTKLVIYEPAKSLSFNVARTSGQQYNLTCRAGQMFPRPTLSLLRYRAGPLEPQPQLAHRPRLAATLLRQEPIAGVHSQLAVSAQSAPSGSAGELAEPALYEASAWALVDESSLSSNVLTQFECLLGIEGTAYEQRQSLALHKGWHVNSATLVSRSTLVGLFSALASLLCLSVALASTMLILRLLKRHANSRVHQMKANDHNDPNDNSSSPAPPANLEATNQSQSPDLKQQLPKIALAPPLMAQNNHQSHYQIRPANKLDQQMDGVYRVPETALGSRFIIGNPNRHYYAGPNQLQASSPQASPTVGRPLYC